MIMQKREGCYGKSMNLLDLFDENRAKIFQQFKQNHNIIELKDWQKNYILSRKSDERLDLIMQLPPGAGKTILSIWTILEQIARYPRGRILYCVPLRALASQQARDIQKDLDILNDMFNLEGSLRFRVGIAEGPGATINLHANAVTVATYEHAASEIRNNPRDIPDVKARRWISTVIIDEIHELGKDRGLVVDDILYFSYLRKISDETDRPPWKRLKIVGMSGTLPWWMIERIQNAYPNLFSNGIISPEELGIEQPKPLKSIFLPAKTNINGYVMDNSYQIFDMIRDILDSVIQSWCRNEKKRMVVFLDSIANTESAYIYMFTSKYLKNITEMDKTKHFGFTAPSAKLATQKSEIAKRLDRIRVTLEADPNTILLSLEKCGIYLHHAQINGPPFVKDEIEKQIGTGGDFICVFSTSTLSTGMNLAPIQIGFLGPNTNWTVDQAEQMMGRVGRRVEDKEKSIVYAVESRNYQAPGTLSLCVPDAWFTPRLLSAISFYEKSINECIDIRGFYKPVSSTPYEIPDVLGNGIYELAQQWGLINSSGITKFAKAAMTLSLHDTRSVETTLMLLTSNKGVTWKTILVWAMLLTRIKFSFKGIKNSDIRLKDGLTTESLFDNDEMDLCRRMIYSYGKTHSRFPKDPDVPSKYTIDNVMMSIARAIIYTGTSWLSWPYYSDDDVPVDLIHSIADALSFVLAFTSNKDNSISAISQIIGECNLEINSNQLIKSIYDASEFLTSVISIDKTKEYKQLPLLRMDGITMQEWCAYKGFNVENYINGQKKVIYYVISNQKQQD